MYKKALVTGGAGFIGQHLVRQLLAQGTEVTVLDDLSSGRKDNLPAHQRLRFMKGSVLVEKQVAEVAKGAEIIFHLAGVVGMRLAMRLREHAYRVAVEGTRSVLAVSESIPVVLFSSSAVYGLLHGGLASEDTPVDISGTLAYDGGARGYSTGKLESECLGLQAAENGRRILIVRPFNVVGIGQTGTYGMVIPTFIDNALENRPLQVFGSGLQSRTFSEVETFVSALLRVVTHDAAWRIPDNVMNIGATQSTTILELAKLVMRKLGPDMPIEYVPYEQAFPGKVDVFSRTPDITRLERFIGGVDWPPLEQVIDDIIHSKTRRTVLIVPIFGNTGRCEDYQEVY